MGLAGHHVRPLAVAAFRNVEQGFQHPPGKVVRIRDLRRDHAEAVGIEIRDVFLQTERADIVPCALARLKQGCCFCHGSKSSRGLILSLRVGAT